MRSSTILKLHCGFDVLIVAAAIAASVTVYATSIRLPIIAGSIAFSLGMNMLWRICGGCPLTHLESKLRTREGREPYGNAGCIAYYLWFLTPKAAARLSKGVSHGVFLAPALTGVVRLLIW